MSEIIKETITSNSSSVPITAVVKKSVKPEASSYQTFEYLVYFFFGFLEILLAFRLILKLAGASLSSSFVSALYSVTYLFVWPFDGIFRKGFSQGLETTSVIEPSTLVAIFVYAFMSWGIVKFSRIFSGEEQIS